MNQKKWVREKRLTILLVGLRLITRACCSLLGAPCYDHNRNIVQDDNPCSPDLEHSFCCGLYYTCLDIGVCTNANTTGLTTEHISSQRATCTDSTWQSDQCPKFCLDRQSIPTQLCIPSGIADSLICSLASRSYTIWLERRLLLSFGRWLPARPCDKVLKAWGTFHDDHPYPILPYSDRANCSTAFSDVCGACFRRHPNPFTPCYHCVSRCRAVRQRTTLCF